ncbi:MAG: EcsC family protein [Bacillaceae bacterium]|nr:EcsC family protein [Bacillaceae bacterium]
MQGREQKVLEEIQSWELDYFQETEHSNISTYQNKLFEHLEEKFPTHKEVLTKAVDTFIFHIHAIMKNSKYDEEIVKQILNHGRVFDSEIESVNDMKKLSIDHLRFIADQQLAKQRLLSLAQGGITGLSNPLILLSDLPVLLALHLRSIQLAATTYGHDLREPKEMFIALKLFHVATMPKSLQKQSWNLLSEELASIENESVYFSDHIQVTTTMWLQQPLRQLAKAILIFSLRNKLYKGVPLFGLTLGAVANYQLAKQVTEISHQFYQKRHVLYK